MFPVMYLKVRSTLKKILPVTAENYDTYKDFFDAVLKEYQPSRYATAMSNDDYKTIIYHIIDSYFSTDKINWKIDMLNKYLYIFFGIRKPKIRPLEFVKCPRTVINDTYAKLKTIK